ncbi:MAG: acyl-CoA thioesterase [Brevibacterium aurantiacum]|uniref:Thioesterase n=1 Tax=Brevibacterium aurantiacum TaxID=273384 RepID=A0A1D7VZG2_BREAU|nr:thioesterase family protein [Brevibacterium aurantiacum]MDN5552018.1 acyl-CoA thioesterase [Brevibacterium sp.]AOP52110.1 4-hydroxybenzoyl-CoA thioesterase [Brevibacterium aurantiacum]AZL04510.1 acyl-CoA thioesterase [Brevibacterium aurantiacum]AZL08100.1 acyl-CoA thioesterase [Brevibacterium aurantiacum]AZL11714.1 acyl-CoA thioesterase [Brevibacterium aurantiacum]
MKTFEYSPEVRWSDQDMLGHVNNARLITLIEEGRIRWMHEIKAGHITGGGLLVAHQSIDYLVPVMYGPTLTMSVSVTKLGNSSFTINTRGDQDGRQVFDHSVVLVHIDRDSAKPTPLTPQLRAVFEEYLPEAD